MTTTRVFGNNPFEVYLKPTNKIQIKVSGSGLSKGDVVAYNTSGQLVKANASSRVLSSVVGIVISVTSNTVTIVTQGAITDADLGSTVTSALPAGNAGTVYFLSDSQSGKMTDTPPVALGTTRIAVLQKIQDGWIVLGTPGIVNGISYRGYVNIAAIQPIGTVAPFVGSEDSLPKNWLLCDGSYVSIDTYPELYRLLGSIYGPVTDGRFKLPDFRGRTLVGAGSGSSLTTRFIGELGGEEKHQLSLAEMPAHNHKPAIGTNDGVDFWWGSDDRVGSPNFDYDGSAATKPSDGFIAPSYKTNTVGGNSPHNNMPPYSVANWIIRAKAESEFALLDVNVESLTNVEKGITSSNGDTIRYDGSSWRFVQDKITNSKDIDIPTDVSVGGVVSVVSVSDGVPSFTISNPTGTNIFIPASLPASHTNGSPRPASTIVTLGSTTDYPLGRKGLVHIHGTLEIEPTNGSADGTVNMNFVGYSGSGGIDVFDTITLPHYVKGDIKKMKIPVHVTVGTQIYQSGSNSVFKYSYYLSTSTGSQFKANKLTIDNVKFVF